MFKVSSHLTFAFAFALTSPSKFNIASMEMQTQTHRIGLNPFLTFYIDAMLNVDANANAYIKCEQSIRVNYAGRYYAVDIFGRNVESLCKQNC